MPSVYAGLGPLASAGSPRPRTHLYGAFDLHLKTILQQNAGREDQFLSDNDLNLNNLQRRSPTTVITVSGVEA